MAASASPLGNAGAGTDSKGGGEARQRRTTEKDRKLSDNGTKEKEKVMEDGLLLEDRKAKLYVRVIALAYSLNRALKVRLGILFNQEQLVTDEVDDEREEFEKKIIANMYKETDDLHAIHKAVMDSLSFLEEEQKQMEFILSILEDAQQRRGKKIDEKVMNVLLQYKQHFDDDCLGKSPVVDKIERFRNERGFMKTIFEERIYNP